MPACGNESLNWKTEIKREPIDDEPTHATEPAVGSVLNSTRIALAH